MKKLLLLGGSTQQIPAIEYANNRGIYTILCDYLSDNPGQYISSKFYCVSTTDKEAILKVAIDEQIDGIVAYASDPATPTAAYVAEKLGLPTNPYQSVDILAYKDKFRQFLQDNDFNCPKTKSYSSFQHVEEDLAFFSFPVMVKPIDSSGSKGVSKADCIDDVKYAFYTAMDNSRSKKVIIEEFILRDHEYMIGGDCFVLNGKVEYWGLLNCHRNSRVNNLVPVGKSYPLLLGNERVDHIKGEVQRVVDLLNIQFGGFNLEIMIDNQNRVFLIEMGPRNGGNMIPDLLKIIHGINLIGATVETAMGNKNIDLTTSNNLSYFGTLNLHTDKNGIFLGINYKNGIEEKIIKKVIYKNKGDKVEYFDGANKAIGILFFEFDTEQEWIDFMGAPEKWIEVIVK